MIEEGRMIQPPMFAAGISASALACTGAQVLPTQADSREKPTIDNPIGIVPPASLSSHPDHLEKGDAI
jgi:hypothetical protein